MLIYVFHKVAPCVLKCAQISGSEGKNCLISSCLHIFQAPVPFPVSFKIHTDESVVD